MSRKAASPRRKARETTAPAAVSPPPSEGKRIEIYDTTLRDGAQSEHVSYSLPDKLGIARRLDELGVDYIEGGWPGSNPKDIEFFQQARSLSLKQARIAAFGATRHAKNAPESDRNLLRLVESGAPVLTIVGKTWDFHVTEALRVELKTNLEMIQSSLEFLRPHCEKLFFDAEHFFDGYRRNPEYALAALRAAEEGGADLLVLCDTNGGCLMEEIAATVSAVRERFGVPLGIHTHNDGGLALANTLVAVDHGCTHVQGTINGFGERCGNADLIAVVANLRLKKGYDCLRPDSLRQLTDVSRYVYEVGLLPLRDNQPFVGRSAFAHKGGIHVSAVARAPATYEHITPESVGNKRNILISELSGRANLLAKAGRKFRLERHQDKLQQILDTIMERENRGYVYEAAEASFEILVRKVLGTHKNFFKLHSFRVSSDIGEGGAEPCTATVKVEVKGRVEHTAAEGNGPVHALDTALRQALSSFYPEIADVRLVDFKVRITNPKAATAASTLVMIRSADSDGEEWVTVGVSENIIEASWIALVDSIDYKLLKEWEAWFAAQNGNRREAPESSGESPPEEQG